MRCWKRGGAGICSRCNEGEEGGGGKKGSWYEIIGVFLLHISNIDLYDKSKLAHKG